MLIQQIAPVAGHEFAPIFVALELSRSKWLVGVALWRYLETGLVPEGAVLKRA